MRKPLSRQQWALERNHHEVISYRISSPVRVIGEIISAGRRLQVHVIYIASLNSGVLLANGYRVVLEVFRHVGSRCRRYGSGVLRRVGRSDDLVNGRTV